MIVRDFSILLEPVNTTASKKDVSLVSGYNAYAQYIEHVMKTQKKELVSNMNLGTEYFTYIFGTNDRGVMEENLSAYVEAAIPKLADVKVRLTEQYENEMFFNVTFTFFDGIKIQKNISCSIEVPL